MEEARTKHYDCETARWVVTEADGTVTARCRTKQGAVDVMRLLAAKIGPVVRQRGAAAGRGHHVTYEAAAYAELASQLGVCDDDRRMIAVRDGSGWYSAADIFAGWEAGRAVRDVVADMVYHERRRRARHLADRQNGC